ncbi:MAG TPA: condensation domain-containing protein [Baekduia sp.]
MRSVSLSLLDELFLNLDSVEEPWGVHLEARVSGRLDAERVAAALAAAARRHPLARARLARAHPSDANYRWEVADALPAVPLAIAECRDEAELAAARDRWFAVSPSLEAAPPFRLLLVHGPDGDALLINLHHAAGDGLGALRLLRSILRAYAGEDDPAPAPDRPVLGDLHALSGPRSPEERRARLQAHVRATVAELVPAARLAPAGGAPRPGYGFELLELSADDTAALVARRRPGTTVNDVLLAALAVTVRRWNERHDRPTARIALTMPVNLRPTEWRKDVLGNFAAYATISVAPADACDVATALPAVADATANVKRHGLAASVVDGLVGPALLPVAAKRRLQDLIPLTGNSVVDTATLSNLGVIDDLPELGEAGSVRQLWFSPPMRMPLGAALGVVTVGGRLQVALRYRHPQFGGPDARAFVSSYRDVVLSAL